MNASLPDDALRGALISEHPARHPARRRITGWLSGAGLVLLAAGALGLLAVGIVLLLPLVALMGLILGSLMLPLLLTTVLHPQVTVYEHGLWIEPLLWGGAWVPWHAITEIAPHTLIRRGEPTRFVPAYEGQLVIAPTLPRVFTITGVMAGLGWIRAFGVASNAQTDYPDLRRAIQQHAPRRTSSSNRPQQQAPRQ